MAPQRAALIRGTAPTTKLLHEAMRAVRLSGIQLAKMSVYEAPPSVLLTLDIPGDTLSQSNTLYQKLFSPFQRRKLAQTYPVYFSLSYAETAPNSYAVELSLLRRRQRLKSIPPTLAKAEQDLQARLFAAIVSAMPLA